MKKEIEVVAGVIIENNKGEILMCKSPKWSDKWTMPGGHIDHGETIKHTAIREGKEETSLDLEYVDMVCHGELINSVDFHRPAHFIFFDVYCRVLGGELKLQENELTESIWILPSDALKLDLAESYDSTIQKFIDYKKKI